MSGTGTDLVLHFFSGPEPIGPFSVPAGAPAVLGRSDTCAVQIRHGSVSGEHAALSRLGDGVWTITDLGSTNGTYVDEMALEPREAHGLGDHCLLGLGAWILQVELPRRDDPPVAIDVRRDPEAARSDDLRTNPTIFLRLRHDDTIVRELSWEEFDQSYRPVILGFARNLGLPERDREDVLQVVLTKFFETADFQYDPSRRFRGWLKVVTRNAIIEHLRREHGEQSRAIEHALLNPGEVEDRWNREWSVQIIRRALEEARPSVATRTWEAFLLAARDGLSASQVAATLGMAPESVRQAKSRVRARVEAIIRRIRETEG